MAYLGKSAQQGTVIENIERPSAKLVERYRELYSAFVLDEFGKLGALSAEIGPLSPGLKICGPAVTSLGADLTVRRMAIDLAQPGDVLVVAAGGSADYACFGDGTAGRMLLKGLTGAVVDGCVRDAAGLRALGFAAFCRGVTPRNFYYPAGLEHGAVNVPVHCGGVLVKPGDLVLGDDDGVVVVDRLAAAEHIDRLEANLADERATRGAWTDYVPFDVRAELVRRGFVFHEHA